MTDQEINIAITEYYTGYAVCPHCLHEIDPEVCQCGKAIALHTWLDGHAPVPMGCTCGYAKQTPDLKGTLTDYCHDLNAIHEVEKTLSDPHLCYIYQIELEKVMRITGGKGIGKCDEWTWNASARQRAEAFLRTIGSWKSETQRQPLESVGMHYFVRAILVSLTFPICLILLAIRELRYLPRRIYVVWRGEYRSLCVLWKWAISHEHPQ